MTTNVNNYPFNWVSDSLINFFNCNKTSTYTLSKLNVDLQYMHLETSKEGSIEFHKKRLGKQLKHGMVNIDIGSGKEKTGVSL